MQVTSYSFCTPQDIMHLLNHLNIDLSRKREVSVRLIPILGKPTAMMLLNANCTVTICHSRTEDLAAHIKRADIIVGAVGVPELIKSDWIKSGAVVIDAGFHPTDNGGVGDIDMNGVEKTASAYTPVPGGVGPMTINTLSRQTVDAAEISAGSKNDMA